MPPPSPCPACDTHVVNVVPRGATIAPSPEAPCADCPHAHGVAANQGGHEPTCGMAQRPATRFHLLVRVPDTVSAPQARVLQQGADGLDQLTLDEACTLLADLTEMLLGPYPDEQAMHEAQQGLAAAGISASPHLH